MFKSRFVVLMVFAVLASSLLWGCDTPENGEVILASIADDQLIVTYSKDYTGCAYLLDEQDQVTHSGDFYCQEGTAITVAHPLSEFNGLAIGDSVKLCRGDGTSLCSEPVTIIDGSSLEYDPALFAAAEDPDAAEPIDPRVLIAGDSWAYIMDTLKILDAVLASHSTDLRNKVIGYTYPGTSATELLGDLASITDMLNTNPTIDIVILSIGGIDLMGMADVSYTLDDDGNKIPNMSDETCEEEISEIKEEIQQIAEGILAVRSNIKVLLLSYDYPNFDESLNWPMDLLGSETIYGWTNGDETTTAREINDFVIMLGLAQWEIANGNDRIYFQNNIGLMQYRFGYLKHWIFPRTVDLPVATPTEFIAGGNPDFYSPPRGMLHIMPLWVDANHLSYRGYKFILERTYDAYLEEWLLGE